MSELQYMSNCLMLIMGETLHLMEMDTSIKACGLWGSCRANILPGNSPQIEVYITDKIIMVSIHPHLNNASPRHRGFRKSDQFLQGGLSAYCFAAH